MDPIESTAVHDSPKEEPPVATGGIITGLAELNPKALIDEAALARVLGRTQRTIRRMVKRGQLPPPIPFGGKNTWVVGKILAFIDAQAERIAEEASKWREAARTKRTNFAMPNKNTVKPSA